MITAKMSLADIVKQYPQTIPYLNNLHLDYTLTTAVVVICHLMSLSQTGVLTLLHL